MRSNTANYCLHFNEMIGNDNSFCCATFTAIVAQLRLVSLSLKVKSLKYSNVKRIGMPNAFAILGVH